jgi:hypothetical protein
MGTRTAQELWKRLVDEAGEDEIERAASVSVAQAERELAEAGFDVAAERARAEAFLDELEGRPAPSPAKPANPGKTERRGRVPPLVWVGAAAAAAAGAAVTHSALRDEGKSAQPPPPSPSTPESTRNTSRHAIAAARDLRGRAAVECNAGRARECLSLLDQARAIDPAGDAAPEIRRLREQASGLVEPEPR